MQVNDFVAKKRDLDAHVKFLEEQLLLVEDKQERQRLYSVLDELLAEKLQIDDYVEGETHTGSSSTFKRLEEQRKAPPQSPVQESVYSASCEDHQDKDYPDIRDVQVAKLCEIETGKVVRLCAPSFCPKIGYRWCIYYGQNKKGQYILSEADRKVKRIEESWGESLFFYMDQTKFWKQRMVPIPDEMEELQKVCRVFKHPPPIPDPYTDKNMYTYLGRDDKGEAIPVQNKQQDVESGKRIYQGDWTVPAKLEPGTNTTRKSFSSSLHENYKMLDEMCQAEDMTVSEKAISRRDKGKEKIALPEKVVLFEAHREKLDEKEGRSLAALAQVGEKLREKFALRDSRMVDVQSGGAVTYPLALLKEIETGSQVRLIGPPRISVENFWSTYLGVDEEGYPVLQDEKKRHRINKNYLNKQWAYQDGQVEDRVLELREACSLGQVEKIRKLLQVKIMLDGTHLYMAVQSANLEILKMLHEQNCPYNKHTLSDFCGRSSVEVYNWLKEQGYQLTKQALVSAGKSCNTALLEMFWAKLN